MFAPHPGGRWPRAPIVLRVGAVFAAVFGLQMVASESLAFWGVLYVIPVILVAQGTGWKGGLSAAVLATALVAAWAQLKDLDLDFSAYLAPAVGFFAAALLAANGVRRTVGRDDAFSPVLTAQSPVGGSPPSDHEGRHREARRLAGVATWELDLATGGMLWSDEYQDLYGVDPQQPLASREAFQQIVRPEDRALLIDALERIVRDGTTLEVRYRITRPRDGAERCLRSHIRAHSERGGVVRLIGTAQDVTDLVWILTPRESEMLVLLADGLSGEQIAERLVLSPATVRTHIQNAMLKLGTHTRGQAIAVALRSDQIGS